MKPTAARFRGTPCESPHHLLRQRPSYPPKWQFAERDRHSARTSVCSSCPCVMSSSAREQVVRRCTFGQGLVAGGAALKRNLSQRRAVSSLRIIKIPATGQTPTHNPHPPHACTSTKASWDRAWKWPGSGRTRRTGCRGRIHRNVPPRQRRPSVARGSGLGTFSI